MAIFDASSPGILGRAAQWMTPDRATAMQALGMGLSQLGAGQPVNLSPAYDALMQRQQRDQARRMLEESGLMNRFTPEQRAILAQMEPSAAQSIIAETLFAPPPAPPAPVEINGQLVDPTTMQVLGDFRDAPVAAPQVTVVGPDDPSRATWGLPDDGRAYEVEYDPATMSLRNVSALGAPLVDVNIPGQPQVVGNTGFVAVPDETVEGGVRFVAAPGGPAASDRATSADQRAGQIQMAETMRANIQAIIDDPALNAVTGTVQGRLPAGVPLITGGQGGADVSARLDQVRGAAFLQAIDQLRGLGALSNIEGQTATDAIARLNRAQSADAMRQALGELQAIIDGGITRLRARQGGSVVDQLSPEDRAYLGLD